MPTEKNFKNTINSIYKKYPEDLILYGFVRSCTCVVKTISERSAVKIFLKYFDLSDIDYNFDSCLRIYYKMKKDSPSVCECTKRTKDIRERHIGINAIIEENSINLIYYGWMVGLISIMPNIDIVMATKMYLKSMRISENELENKLKVFEFYTYIFKSR